MKIKMNLIAGFFKLGFCICIGVFMPAGILMKLCAMIMANIGVKVANQTIQTIQRERMYKKKLKIEQKEYEEFYQIPHIDSIKKEKLQINKKYEAQLSNAYAKTLDGKQIEAEPYVEWNICQIICLLEKANPEVYKKVIVLKSDLDVLEHLITITKRKEELMAYKHMLIKKEFALQDLLLQYNPYICKETQKKKFKHLE